MKAYISNFGNSHLVDVRVDTYDTFDLCYTLSCVILPALTEFKKDARISIPGRFCVSFANGSIDWDTSETQWCSVLDKMIYAFDQIRNEEDYMANTNYMDNGKEREEKIDEGLKLFSQYYRTLWR